MNPRELQEFDSIMIKLASPAQVRASAYRGGKKPANIH